MFSTPPPPSAVLRTPVVAGAVALLLVAMVGCSGSRPLSEPDVGDMVNQNLPRVRAAAAHPDSLRNLTVVEEPNRVRLRLSTRYQQLHRDWSSTFQFLSPNREIQNPLTYATLWSKELSLAALEADRSVSSLPKDQARKLIREQRSEYKNTLQIDVYWFSGPLGQPLTGPGAQVRLRDGNGNYYSPTREESGPLRQALIAGGNTALYRRNTFYFKRTADGTDLLRDVNTLYLRVSPTNGPTVQFGWSWDTR